MIGNSREKPEGLDLTWTCLQSHDQLHRLASPIFRSLVTRSRRLFCFPSIPLGSPDSLCSLCSTRSGSELVLLGHVCCAWSFSGRAGATTVFGSTWVFQSNLGW